MLEIIAWLGCAFLVLKGAEIYLSSVGDEDVRRGGSLIVMAIAVMLAGVFAYLIATHVPETTPLIESYKDVQDSVQKSFESISKDLETSTQPAQPSPTDEVIEGIRNGNAMDETPNAADPAAGE
jgi:predicted PurR-regulated permease PerM